MLIRRWDLGCARSWVSNVLEIGAQGRAGLCVRCVTGWWCRSRSQARQKQVDTAVGRPIEGYRNKVETQGSNTGKPNINAGGDEEPG